MNEWFARGVDAYGINNYFEAFIYLWISLVVGTKIEMGKNIPFSKSSQKNIGDLECIKYWFCGHEDIINDEIKGNWKRISALGKRTGSHYGNPIIDASETLRKKFTRLRGYFNGIYVYENNKQLAEDLAELLNKIRNNLFHGDKSYDNRSDRELLSAVLPILMNLTKEVVDSNQ